MSLTILWGWCLKGQEENAEEEYNVEKLLKSCKSPLQKKKSYNNTQEKNNFLFTDKNDDID